MAKKAALSVALVSVLLSSITCGLFWVNLATASPLDHQYLSELTIKSDGNIVIRQVPPPHEESSALGLINRTGNLYILTADIENYSVRIDRSNIVFDGAGHTINALPAFDNSGLEILQVTNVTVRNLAIVGEQQTSLFLASSNCFITNITTQNALRINGEFNTINQSCLKKLSLWGSGNSFTKCNITEIYISTRSASNIFFMNNFMLNNIDEDYFIINTANFWDNGSVGNYWSNYTLKYPNAFEVNNSGIGDTPYIIDQNNIDHFPITQPVGTNATAHPLENNSTQKLIPIIIIPTVVVAVIICTILFYRRYRKTVYLSK